jgi:hypothetical protein
MQNGSNQFHIDSVHYQALVYMYLLGTSFCCLHLQDLDSLVMVFTAKPWRDGCLPLLCFVLRTKAAFAYSTYNCKTCRAHTCTCFKPEASNEPQPEPEKPC